MKETAHTLIELLIILLLSALILFEAVSGWGNITDSEAMALTIHQLITAIDYARIEAVSRRSTVSICPSIDGLSCSGAWDDGYMIFLNKNKRDAVIAKADILRFDKNQFHHGTLIWHEAGILHISPLGNIAVKNGTFTYCPKTKNLNFTREIVISMTGRIRVSQQLTWGCPF